MLDKQFATDLKSVANCFFSYLQSSSNLNPLNKSKKTKMKNKMVEFPPKKPPSPPNKPINYPPFRLKHYILYFILFQLSKKVTINFLVALTGHAVFIIIKCKVKTLYT